LTNSNSTERIGDFLAAWVELEKALRSAAAVSSTTEHSRRLLTSQLGDEVLSKSDNITFRKIAKLRNRLVHGDIEIEEIEEVYPNIVTDIDYLIRKVHDMSKP
jgi:uncharacterized protein YutE (UPF0331/DUF86 family)